MAKYGKPLLLKCLKIWMIIQKLKKIWGIKMNKPKRKFLDIFSSHKVWDMSRGYNEGYDKLDKYYKNKLKNISEQIIVIRDLVKITDFTDLSKDLIKDIKEAVENIDYMVTQNLTEL